MIDTGENKEEGNYFQEETEEIKASPEEMDSNNNKNTSSEASPRTVEKYSLRPRTIIKRIQLERTKQEMMPKRNCRVKSKPPPLSKYRRKTANARERYRMKEINDAFATLRKILPNFACRRPSPMSMTKITTLKLAVSYIRALSEALKEDDLSSGSLPAPPAGNLGMQSCAPTATNSCHGFPVEQLLREEASRKDEARDSMSSTSDITDLLSEDSCVFDDVFDAIPSLPESDSISLFLSGENGSLALSS